VGRPSIDPIVLVKLMLVGALEGIGSMRELLRVASMRLDIRRFLGYGFTERLPVHQTISHAQTRRFVDAKLFERRFLRSVALCGEHGLIDGTHLSVDGFHVEADAALASLRASLAVVDDDGASAEAPIDGDHDGDGDGDACGHAPERPRLAVVEPRSGPGTQAPRRQRDLRLAHGSRRQAARQAGAAPAPGAPRPDRGRSQGALRRGVPGRGPPTAMRAMSGT
jgi:transposase